MPVDPFARAPMAPASTSGSNVLRVGRRLALCAAAFAAAIAVPSEATRARTPHPAVAVPGYRVLIS